MLAVDVDLQASSDSRVADGDEPTNLNSPVFDVTVDSSGPDEIDFDGDGIVDVTPLFAGPGTQSFTSPTLADGTFAISATLTPDVGNASTRLSARTGGFPHDAHRSRQLRCQAALARLDSFDEAGIQ